MFTNLDEFSEKIRKHTPEERARAVLMASRELYIRQNYPNIYAIALSPDPLKRRITQEQQEAMRAKLDRDILIAKERRAKEAAEEEAAVLAAKSNKLIYKVFRKLSSDKILPIVIECGTRVLIASINGAITYKLKGSSGKK